GLAGNSSVAFRLDQARAYLVGRAVECDVVIDDTSVSRRHAELQVAPPGLDVRDLGSRNGTFVDGTRISAGTVVPGQGLSFGHVGFLVIAPADCEDTGEAAALAGAHHPLRSQLTHAQARVFDVLVRGLSEKEMAARLHLSPNTVHHHVAAIYRALRVRSRAEFFARILPRRGD